MQFFWNEQCCLFSSEFLCQKYWTFGTLYIYTYLGFISLNYTFIQTLDYLSSNPNSEYNLKQPRNSNHSFYSLFLFQIKLPVKKTAKFDWIDLRTFALTVHRMINISMSILPVIGWQGVTIQTFTHNQAKVYLYLYSNSENSA